MDPRPDAIFCVNDYVALGAMNAILDVGLRIPEDVALVGCGNVFYDAFFRVPLSSVDQNSASLGQKAGELALALLTDGAAPPPKRIVIESKVVVRASSRRAA